MFDRAGTFGNAYTLLVSLGVIWLLSAASPTSAQSVRVLDLRPSDPSTTQQRDAERREQERLQRLLQQRELERGATPITEATPEPTPSDKPEARFDLKHVEISKSEILTETELREIAAAYEGRAVGMSDIKQMLARLNELYKAKGFLTAQAILPPQKVRDGILKIELIEARIGKVAYEGNRHTSDFYLDHHLPFRPGQLVDIKTAEPALVRFNRLNDAQLRLTLKPGSEPGTTDFVVQVVEPPPYVVDVFTDNQGANTTGQLRGGANLGITSLLGARDVFSFGGYASDGAAAAYVGYDVPFTQFDTRFAFSFDFNNTDARLPGTGNTPKISGDSLNLGLSLTQPVYVSRHLLVRVLTYGGWRQSSTDVENFYTYKFRIKTVGAGISGDWSDPWGSTYFSHRMGAVLDDTFSSVRLNPFSSRRTISSSPPDFFKYQGSFTRLNPINSFLSATFRVSGQVTSISNVPSPEQQQAGGLSSVRGYQEAAALGDDGYVASAQLNAWLPRSEKSTTNGQLGAFLFYDHAGLFTPTTQTYLNGTGLGLMAVWGQYFSSQAVVGFPLTEHDPIGDARFHFAVHIMPPVGSWIDG